MLFCKGLLLLLLYIVLLIWLGEAFIFNFMKRRNNIFVSSYFSRNFQIIWFEYIVTTNLVWFYDCYDQVRRNSCYHKAGLNFKRLLDITKLLDFFTLLKIGQLTHLCSNFVLVKIKSLSNMKTTSRWWRKTTFQTVLV